MLQCWSSLSAVSRPTLCIAQFCLYHLMMMVVHCAVCSYVGNLDPGCTEELLMMLFSQLVPCKGCKIIHEVFPLTMLYFTFLGI